MEASRLCDRPVRSKNRDAPNSEIEKRTVTKSTETWVREFNEAVVPWGPIYAIDQMFEDAQVKHLASRRTSRMRRTVTLPNRHAVAHAEQDSGAAAGIRRADG